MDMFIGDKKKKTIKKKSHEIDQDQIIEEHDKESESNNNKEINSFNLSISNNNSVQETEKNGFNRSHNTTQKIGKKNPRQNLQRRNNVFRMEDQEAIINLVAAYNNPLLFGLKNLCGNINSEDEEESEMSESEIFSKSGSSRNEERKGTLSKSDSSSRSINFDNIKSVEEPIIAVEKKPEEKVEKKMKMKINVKKKIKIKKKIKVKIKVKVKKVVKKEPGINFNDYNFDWLNLINN